MPYGVGARRSATSAESLHAGPERLDIVQLEVGDVEVVVRLLVLDLANGEVLVVDVVRLPLRRFVVLTGLEAEHVLVEVLDATRSLTSIVMPCIRISEA